MKTIIALSVLVLNVIASSTFASQKPVEVPANVDLNRFLGRWYEIAVIPNFFERDCVATNANYSLKPNGRIDVLNICNKKTLNGKMWSAHGEAAVVDAQSKAKLKVTFLKPIWAPYWIIDIDENYQVAITGSPNRKYLWILSRTPHIDEALYNELVMRAKAQGFDVTKLVKTLQP